MLADDDSFISWDDVSNALNGVPSWAVYCSFAGVGVIVILIIVIAANRHTTPSFKPRPFARACTVCGGLIIRKLYFWGNDRMCPRCNSRMKNKVSKEAFKNRFG